LGRLVERFDRTAAEPVPLFNFVPEEKVGKMLIDPTLIGIWVFVKKGRRPPGPLRLGGGSWIGVHLRSRGRRDSARRRDSPVSLEIEADKARQTLTPPDYFFVSPQVIVAE
jgi:hypothetical protein